jgi:hypothetical protein
LPVAKDRCSTVYSRLVSKESEKASVVFDHGGNGHVGLPNHIFNINRYLIDRFVACPGNYAERPTPDSGKARVN